MLRQNSSCVRLLAALRSCAINNTYVSVRAAARHAIETDLERYPKEAPRVVESSADSLMIPEENEDRCRAACEVLKTNSSIVATTQTSSESLLKFAYALLQARCIHDTVISQQAVSETFVNFAARFSRRSMDLLNYSTDGPTPLMNDLVKYIFHPPDERAKHWSFQSMATAFFMFTLVSDCSEKSVRNATRIFLEGLTSDSRPTWLPSACGLLLVSRYKNFEDQMLVDAVNTDFEKHARVVGETLVLLRGSERRRHESRHRRSRGRWATVEICFTLASWRVFIRRRSRTRRTVSKSVHASDGRHSDNAWRLHHCLFRDCGKCFLKRDRTYFAKRWMMSLVKYKRTKTTRDLCPRRRRNRRQKVARGGEGGSLSPADAKSRTRTSILRRRLQHRLLPSPLWTTRLFPRVPKRSPLPCAYATKKRPIYSFERREETRRIFHAKRMASRFGVFNRRTER